MVFWRVFRHELHHYDVIMTYLWRTTRHSTTYAKSKKLQFWFYADLSFQRAICRGTWVPSSWPKKSKFVQTLHTVAEPVARSAVKILASWLTKIKTVHKFLWPLLVVNLSIAGLIWRGTAYFVQSNTTIILPGDTRRTTSEFAMPRAGNPFLAPK